MTHRGKNVLSDENLNVFFVKGNAVQNIANELIHFALRNWQVLG